MALVAPVNLPYNIKTLWFDPNGVDVHTDDKVVVKTARGLELGVVSGEPFDVAYEEIKKLKSPLRPVERVATDEDLERAAEMDRKSREAMPVFKKLARETSEDMHPVSVEYLLDGDKAVFYFESEERIDFRDMVRKLASEFHVRIDMRQIGVRDEARIVGGIAHCGQMVCCKRLGGEFKPVSIRMAKDQDLSLNPQKISGLCGRLMCCLRYENDVYKDFKKDAPKMDAKVETPEGEGRVVEYDVPRNMLSVRVGDEKPVKLPLSAFTDISEDRKSANVDALAWDTAVEEAKIAIYGSSDLFSIPSFTGEDKLGEAKAVHHESSSKDKPKQRSRRRSKSGSSDGAHREGSSAGGTGGASGSGSQGSKTEIKRTPRRRSTTIKADGETKKTESPDGASQQKKQGAQAQGQKKQQSRQRRSQPKDAGEQKLRPGHKSSGLAHDDIQPAGEGQKSGSGSHRRRRRRKPSGGQGGNSNAGGSGNNASGSNNAGSTGSGE